MNNYQIWSFEILCSVILNVWHFYVLLFSLGNPVSELFFDKSEIFENLEKTDFSIRV